MITACVFFASKGTVIQKVKMLIPCILIDALVFASCIF